MSSGIDENSTATVVGRLDTDQQTAQRIADIVAETYDAGAAAAGIFEQATGHWGVALHFSAPPNVTAVRALVALAAGPAAANAMRFERVAAKDWVQASLAGLRPIAAGRFVVHGAHDRARVPVNRIGIEIEAALAFGTGHHGTTRGCLLALDGLLRAHKPRRILDLGTGSGVLAIAVARARHCHVLASDIDASAVRVARTNARLNRAGALVDVVQANGITSAVRMGAPFDLVFANILLGPLKRLATPLSHLLTPNAHVVLSGLLSEQANAAIFAYHELVLERRIVLDGWATLILARRCAVSVADARLGQ
jgi:ribosomal protein L11 methyltransferase